MNVRFPTSRAARSPGRTGAARGIVAAAPAKILALAAVVAIGACGGDEPVQLPRPMADNPAIDYPVELWDAEIEGETLLTVHVDAEGRVDSVRVEETSGSPQLDSAAVRGGRQMRFTPGRRGDRRVGAWIRVPVRFRRDTEETGTAEAPATEGDGTHE